MRSPAAQASKQTRKKELKTRETVVVTLEFVDGYGNCSVALGTTVIVKRSHQPTLAAARALHKLGYPDDTFLVSVHLGSGTRSGQGTVGGLRRQKVREDARTGPRFVRYRPFPSAQVAKQKKKKQLAGSEGADVRATTPVQSSASPEAAPLPAVRNRLANSQAEAGEVRARLKGSR